MGVTGGQALVQAFQGKFFKKLEVLRADDNVQLLLNKGVVKGLVKVLERHAELCPCLSVVMFSRSGQIKGEEGM